MATKSLICGAVLIAGLIGCAGPRALAPVVCNSGRCDVDVQVTDCVITTSDIDNTGANNIFWNISSPGYAFPDETVHLGVWLKNPPPSGCDSPVDVFKDPKRQSNTQFKLHDKGTRGTYCYGVTVVKTTTTPPTMCPSLDPSIVNR